MRGYCTVESVCCVNVFECEINQSINESTHPVSIIDQQARPPTGISLSSYSTHLPLSF